MYNAVINVISRPVARNKANANVDGSDENEF